MVVLRGMEMSAGWRCGGAAVLEGGQNFADLHLSRPVLRPPCARHVAAHCKPGLAVQPAGGPHTCHPAADRHSLRATGVPPPLGLDTSAPPPRITKLETSICLLPYCPAAPLPNSREHPRPGLLRTLETMLFAIGLKCETTPWKHVCRFQFTCTAHSSPCHNSLYPPTF